MPANLVQETGISFKETGISFKETRIYLKEMHLSLKETCENPLKPAKNF